MDQYEKVVLWEAINAYARSCGGDPGKHVHGNTERQNLVVKIEAIIEETRDSDCDGFGKCHGSKVWCDSCGDTRRVCEDPMCDIHCAEGVG